MSPLPSIADHELTLTTTLAVVDARCSCGRWSHSHLPLPGQQPALARGCAHSWESHVRVELFG